MNKMLSIIRNFIQAINFFEEKSVLYRDNFIESSKKEPSLADYNRGEIMVERVLFRDRKHPVDRVIINDFNRKSGADLGEVKIVYGPAADEYTRSHHALALVLGTDIFFRNGAYRPETEEGRKILAHELTHVTQQKRDILRGETTREELEREAEAAEKLFEWQGERTKTVKIENIVYKLSEREYNKFMAELKDQVEEELERKLGRVDEEERLKLLYAYKKMTDSGELPWQQ